MSQAQQDVGRAVVTPPGDVVASSLEAFRQNLLEQIEAGCRDLVIDLANVEVIDSRGLAVFMLCHKTLHKLGGQLTVVAANGELRQLFRVMRMDQHIGVVEKL